MTLGFELDFWDYLTFATAALAGAAGILTYIWLAGLPGRIAIARKHPEAEAVRWMGWAGLLPTVLPWIQAFIWAFKPTDIVDIRRFPREEARAIEEDMARLTDDPGKHDEPARTTDPATSARDAAVPRPPPSDGKKA
jgi:hypothetical protein